MKLFRFQLRLLIPLGITLAVASAFAFLAMERLTQQWFSKDLRLRGALVASAMSESITKAVETSHPERLAPLFERTLKDERLSAIGLCNREGQLLLATRDYPAELSCQQAFSIATQAPPKLVTETESFHVAIQTISNSANGQASIILLHDMAYVERRTLLTRQYLLAFVISIGVVIALTTILAAQMSWNNWVKSVRSILRGEGSANPGQEIPPDIASDIRARLRDLEDEYRRMHDTDDLWTAEKLGSLLRTRLRGDQVIVVSNREPWTHDRQEEDVTIHQPASGLVTALEPVVCACAGTWIAHGNGSADRETVDAHDHIRLPPDQEKYTLRRIWLSNEELTGYYDGMSNRGIWPLAHMAHIQPVFQESDWQHYRSVNRRFAEAVAAEARVKDPVILIQDYHLALVPAMVRALLPDATIITFWHIPWPNPESFSIFPWKHEMLMGLLGSTIIGFQTSHHRRNFLDAVDQSLEVRVDHEHSSVIFNGEEIYAESYPISIAWPDSANTARLPPACQNRTEVCQRYGLTEDTRIILGVDRCDYSKGILERLLAFELLLHMHPELAGKVAFLQIAAPTREHLDEYRELRARIGHKVAEINSRFGRPGYRPVHLLARFHTHEEILPLYRAADVCMVSSLHDGMNLVCKEYVAARDDEQGVLLLSQFAGAARDLPEALCINPYHLEGMAETLLRALTMPPAEQRERMSSLRMTVREANVFRWAAHMLADAGRQRLRQRVAQRVQSNQRHIP